MKPLYEAAAAEHPYPLLGEGAGGGEKLRQGNGIPAPLFRTR